VSDEPIILPPGGGRTYDLGALRGAFKHDDDAYCASEWAVEPRGAGPGPHHHDANEEVFLVTEGTLWFLVGDAWVEAPRGTFLRIPAGVTHDFENRSDSPATAFNVFLPGGFEAPFRAWHLSRAG
jgi:mannose-6-phosphate isomerase-like protein (cupin superfamily)